MTTLEQELDRVLGLSIVFEETEGVIFTRSEWMTSDPELVYTLATTTSSTKFKTALRELAKEIGDTSVIQALKSENPEHIINMARREARIYAPEIISNIPQANLPKNLKKASLGGVRPHELLGKSKEEIEQFYTKRREMIAKKLASQTQKKYFGDTIWGIYQNDKLIKGDYRTKQDAEIEITERPDKYSPDEGYEVREYENPKSLSKLKDMMLPAQNGWSTDEIVAAMMPYLYKMAYKYQSIRVPREDLVQQGVIGILDAIRLDGGKSPFTAYASKFIKTNMRRLALVGGIIKGSERGDLTQKELEKTGFAHGGAASFKEKGGLIGYDVIWFDKQNEPHKKSFGIVNLEKGKAQDPGYIAAKQFKKELETSGEASQAFNPREIRGGMASVSAPVGGDDEKSLGSTLKATKTKSPTYIARQAELVDQLVKKSDMSPQQEKAVRLSFGFDVPEAGIKQPGIFRASEPHLPGEQTGIKPEDGQKSRVPEEPFARGFADVAEIMGIDKKRARELVLKGIIKLNKAAEQEKSKYSKTLLGDEPKEEIIRLANGIMMIEDYMRNIVIKWVITGELNGAFIQE